MELDPALGHLEQVVDVVLPVPRAHDEQVLDIIRDACSLQAAEYPSSH